MRYFCLDGTEIAEDEAKRVEAQNREILRYGTVEELLKIRYVVCEED